MGNQDIKVSIVLLIYMVEKYLPKCIESAIKQTYKNIEIILAVTNGKDRCMDICREYEAKDDRVKVIESLEKGRGPGRNVAMKEATGEYILFIDGDDWMGSTMVEKLLTSAIKYDSDVAICGDIYEYENSDRTEKLISNLPEVFDRERLYKEILSRKSFGLEVWNKLYRFSLIKDIEFPNCIAEDRYWSVEAFERISKISYVPSAEMHYVVRQDSGSRKPHNSEISMKADAIMFDNILGHGYLKQEASNFLFISCYNAIYEALHFGYFDYEKWEEVYRKMRKLAGSVIKYGGTRKQDKVKAIVSRLGYHAFISFIQISEKIKPAGIYDESEKE